LICGLLGYNKGEITSLRTEIQEWKNRTSTELPDMSALDAAMAAPFSVWGPIDDLFEGLGDDFAGLGEANGGGAGDAEADDDEE
ncbi:hypothetical protein HAX54_013965, partial [Datura stramonium]|nr:hypothetical protein [Datura stramonium]